MSKIMIAVVACSLCGYLIGTLNPAFLIAKLRGFDIRESGSGNAGASNAVITMGKMVGLFAAIFDILKAVLAVRMAKAFFPDLIYAGEVAGICAILGHIFPFTMGFRGGKGLASLGGVILAFNWKVFCLMLLAELVLVILVDYICFVPITASIGFPVVYFLMTQLLLGAVMYALLIPLYIYKHLENLQRIKEGTELHVSFLWHKDAEIKRVSENRNSQ